MHLVVGLGNPGDRFADTRHNIGFDVVDALRARTGPGRPWPGRDWWAEETSLEGAPLLLLKPLTFVNRSGPAVGEALEQSGLGPERLLVIVDDVALPTGRIRVRARGSHGGHNGLRSIQERLGAGFPRLRVGVGAAPGGELADHVLSKFPNRDILIVRRAIGRAADAVVAVLREGVEAAMNRFNAEPVPEPDGADGAGA